MGNEILNESISVAELSQSFSQLPDQLFIIDLMNSEDFAARHIPGAVNIPLEELENHVQEIPKDKTVVACKMGLKKSELALEQLRKSGFTNARKLSGGTAGWFDFKTTSEHH
jgi:rhodanese-related sulfurtransferase